ncbi:hypothetical protein [Pseudolactococcus hodotermopsidis]|uniref:hypothetical protein n=1 Tax=Pseudolactococcus hodotermopsidis TaxID=2709157 RepID=UPI001553187C|nr:hypothetical protein [Lactococcus hodotermopsidis]
MKVFLSIGVAVAFFATFWGDGTHSQISDHFLVQFYHRFVILDLYLAAILKFLSLRYFDKKY